MKLIHVSISSGSLIAAVIGSSKFMYDIFGNTVNVASRMMSSSEDGKIQVTEPVYQKLQKNFVLEKRGEVFIKGKGKMYTWWLKDRLKKEITLESLQCTENTDVD